MAEENELADTIAEALAPTEEGASAPEKRRAGGPGFLLGIIVGALTGAAAATLLAPPTGEEQYQRQRAPDIAPPSGEGPFEDAATARLRAVLDRVRSRVQEASEEAHEASRETEERLRARYTELTEQQ